MAVFQIRDPNPDSDPYRSIFHWGPDVDLDPGEAKSTKMKGKIKSKNNSISIFDITEIVNFTVYLL
jgi:hypothetical protein